MPTHAPDQPQAPKLKAFHLSCWLLALLAFLQIASLGTAVALKNHPPATAPEPEIITRYLPAPRPVTTSPPVAPKPAATAASPVELPPIPVTPSSAVPPSAASLIPPQVTDLPPAIADPIVERLVKEAREARMSGDNMSAITKLEDALQKAPGEANSLYELAGTFEDMGIYDKASDHYLRVYQLGPVKAGSLWKKAGTKLETGFKPDTTGLAGLGFIQQMPPQASPEGTRYTVRAPVKVNPGREFDPSQLQIKVHFYEKRNNKVEKAQVEIDGADWLSAPLDWADGEELVEVWYVIPPADAYDEQLYGPRRYYGYLAELYYDNELVDVRFHPRTLMNDTRELRPSYDPQLDPLLDGFDPGEGFDPDDYEPGNPLLPPLPSY